MKTCFGKVNPVYTAKHKLYQLHKTNKDLEVFLNTFWQLSIKPKIDTSQVLNILYKKLSNEFKNRLITVKKAKYFSDLILLLHNIDVNMKKISKQFQIYVKPNAFYIYAIKPLFQSYNLGLTKFSIAIAVTVFFSVSIIALGNNLGPIDLSIVIKQRLIL